MSSVWFPTIFPDRCDGCEGHEVPRCIKFCPNDVFMLIDGEIVVARPQNCVYGCTACEPVCAKKAISFPSQETAFAPFKSKDKGLLRKATCVKCGKTYWMNREVDVCMDCESKM